jgi:dihydropteroate synthase
VERPKDTSFRTLNLAGQLMSFARSRVMAIVNLTPDSFYDGGRWELLSDGLRQVEKLADEGADILDLGAASSRPGAEEVPLELEWDRLKEIIPAIRKRFPELPISVDTWRAEIAERALGEGVAMINDISAGQLDPGLLDVVERWKVPYVLMHMQGTPSDMQEAPSYSKVVDEQLFWFSQQLDALTERGLNDVLLDPGFGFGKTLEHNYQILHSLDRYRLFGRPIMVGLSRKSMVQKVLECAAEDALNGSTVLHTLALLKGADLLRVHDVREAREAIALVEKYELPDRD